MKIGLNLIIVLLIGFQAKAYECKIHSPYDDQSSTLSIQPVRGGVQVNYANRKGPVFDELYELYSYGTRHEVYKGYGGVLTIEDSNDRTYYITLELNLYRFGHKTIIARCQ
ncbi:hypothetical protein [Bdellovibrio bacteriovorus]|uniref:hypothetical protein n=1 Tax=Bdellovibrio bacteriovorus TaxID=959 RepID=UPI0035A6B4A5